MHARGRPAVGQAQRRGPGRGRTGRASTTPPAGRPKTPHRAIIRVRGRAARRLPRPRGGHLRASAGGLRGKTSRRPSRRPRLPGSGGCGWRSRGRGSRTAMPTSLTSGDGIVLVDTGIGGEGGIERLGAALAGRRLRTRGRAPSRLHPRAHGPLRPRRPDRRHRRLRALDAPGLGARAADGGGPDGRARAADRGRPSERGAAPRRWRATKRSRRGSGNRLSTRVVAPGPRATARASRSRPTPAPGRSTRRRATRRRTSFSISLRERLLLSGDHVLGHFSLFFDYGHTPDLVCGVPRAPSTRWEALEGGARACLGTDARFATSAPRSLANRPLWSEHLVRGPHGARPRSRGPPSRWPPTSSVRRT